MSKIEFVYQNKKIKKYCPQMLSIDVKDIKDIISINKHMSQLFTNNGSYYVFGKFNIHINRINQVELVGEDLPKNNLIRPSINLKYNLEKVNVDRVLMDASQLKGFIDVCLSLEGYSEDEINKTIENMQDFARDEIQGLEKDYWKIPEDNI